MMQQVNHERAKEVVLRVHTAFRKREGLLANIHDLVEFQIPDGVVPLSREHALFLFYTVVNDHGMKSSRLYAKAKQLFSEDQSLFKPEEILSKYTGPDDILLIENTGKKLGTRYPKETAKIWYLNSRKLLDDFTGDPRKIFLSTSDARMLIKRIMAFRGYGPKIGGMLLRAAIGLGFAKVEGIEDVLLPVDIHDSRISFFTGIIKVPDQDVSKIDYYAHVKQVQRILLSACNALGLEWLDTDRALWLIGSRGCVTRKCEQCPLNDICYIGITVINRGKTNLKSEQAF